MKTTLLPAPTDTWKVHKPYAYQVLQRPDLIEVEISQVAFYALDGDRVRAVSLDDIDDTGRIETTLPGTALTDRYRIVNGYHNALTTARAVAEAALDHLPDDMWDAPHRFVEAPYSVSVITPLPEQTACAS